MDNVSAQLSPPAAPAAERPFPRRSVMRAAVDLAAPQQVLEYLTACAQNRHGCSVAGVSAPYATAMADDSDLRDAFLSADLLIADGKGFVWGARLLGVDCGERLAIPDLCETLLETGAKRGWRVFLYGATEDVNRAACENLRQRFPGLGLVTGQHGYNQSAADEDAVIERLRGEQFNLLIVARPTPDKEKFLARCCKHAGVVGVAAGGYADILAGKTSRAPALVQAVGCEWLYRVAQEPRRLWKRIGWANTRFAAAVLWRHLLTFSGRPWWSSRAVQVCAIALAITAAYVPYLNAPYHFDDPEYIARNPTIRSFKALSDINVLAHRKLWWLSNAVCYWLSEQFGAHQVEKPDVRFFRGWNIACQFIAALALLGLLRRALRASSRDHGPGTPAELAAFGAAAIFAAHPLCTESVTYICGRDNGQGGMFYLLGLFMAAVAFDRLGLGAATAAPAAENEVRWPRWFWPLILSLLFGGCAVLTKESHLTYPAAVGLVYLVFYRGTEHRTVSVGLLLGIVASMLALAWGAAGRRDGYLGVAAELMLLFIVGGALLGRRTTPSVSPPFEGGEKERPAGTPVPPAGWRAFLQRRVGRNWAFVAGVLGLAVASVVAFPYAYQRTLSALTGFQDSSYVRSLCSQAYAVPCLLLRGVAPFGLNIDHEFPSISDPADPRTLIGAAVLAALLAIGIVGLVKRSLAGFAVLLALLSIAPTNSIIERGDIVSERNFYLVAAAGACLIAWGMSVFATWAARRLAATETAPAGAHLLEAGLWTAVLSCCFAGPFVAFTFLRNHEWSDAYLLWDAAIQRSPNRMRVLHNYGVACFTRGEMLDRQNRHPEATAFYEKADWAFTNAIKIGEDKSARKLFRPDEVVELKCFHLAYRNLAAMHLRRYISNPDVGGREAVGRVEMLLNKGLERTAYDPDLALCFAQFMMDLRRPLDALPILERSMSLHLYADHLWQPLGRLYLEAGNFAKSAHYLDLALRVKESNTVGVYWDPPAEHRAELYAFLGLAKLKQRLGREAREAFRLSLELDSQGIIMLLTMTRQTVNPKLKPLEMNPPDSLLIALSQTHREILQTLILALDDVLKARPATDRNLPAILRDAMQSELVRREQAQEKRRQFGFTDDPDK